VAARESGMEAFEPCSSPPDVLLDRFGRVHSTECDLKWSLHGCDTKHRACQTRGLRRPQTFALPRAQPRPRSPTAGMARTRASIFCGGALLGAGFASI
jgi:hypothetical protein